MAEQLNFNELFGDSVSAIGEPHLACVLLLDVSGSMRGNPINSLNDSIRRFKEQVCMDEIARKRVDVAIVTFASKVQVVCDFVPVEKIPPVTLQAEGLTMMAEGINTAIDLVKRRNAFYQQIGIPFFKPWIFMITDGLSSSYKADMDQVAQRIQQEESAGSHGKLKFWVLGFNEYDCSQMKKLTKRVMEMRGYDFTSIFDWLSQSMTAISQSTVGENVPLDDLPNEARVAREDRKIDEGWY